ncbi:fimbria/pilus outer membrane usher protein [Aeromonas jandaei]|uniref:fimbria/pilus outer membrane usher protein n=1 Tax=Aeromonas jandaei TaxID=650 RepID=UPI001EEE3EEB|nr:fimbria/pilus outer membrane usher protein [Aeromonas jandaei]MCF7720506.1 fimbria/pilus outer membrane usher protein [Aeromonas jandaei]
MWLFVAIVYTPFLHAEYEFDPSLLGNGIDLSLLDKGFPPGLYTVDVVLNGTVVDNLELMFQSGERGALEACLSRAQLLRYGVKVDSYPALFLSPVTTSSSSTSTSNTGQCADLSAIPYATSTFDLYSQQLRLSIPQTAIMVKQKGIVPQELWDDGITALSINYRLNANHSRSQSGGIKNSNQQWSAGIDPSFNIGAWRLRNASTWQSGQWQYRYSFAERGLNQLQSRLTLGERFTSSTLFSGVPLTGFMLASDDNMVPYVQRAYSPIIKGTARTQARVEVKQNGYLVYSTTVAPGPFEFSDLSTGGGGGDFDVTVFETDGQPQKFTVSYATPAIALREGAFKYDFAGGYYRPANSVVDDAPLGQFSIMYGLPWGITAYAGAQGASHYLASAIGLGASLGSLGAISFDTTKADWQQQGESSNSGQKWRVIYSKFVESTNSGISLERNVYSPEGFLSMAQVLDSFSSSGTVTSSGLSSWKRDVATSSTSVSLGQSLADWGNISVSGIQTHYAGERTSDESLRISYGTTIKKVGVSFDWSKNYRGQWGNQNNYAEQQFGLRFSYALSFGEQPIYMSYQLRDGDNQAAQHEIGLRGSGLENRLSWDVREQVTVGVENGQSKRSVLNFGFLDKYGAINGGYGYSRDSRQINANVSGGVIIHSDGITFGQPLSQTVGLIIAPDANDVSVGYWPGVRTDFRGYTLLSSLSPYQINEIAINPLTLPNDVVLSHNEIKVTPTAGAIVPVRFATKKGASGIIKITKTNGGDVPFGAVVESVDSKTAINIGIVGFDGDVYMSGLQKTGRFVVRWGSTEKEKCYFNYSLPDAPTTFGGEYEFNVVCK